MRPWTYMAYQKCLLQCACHIKCRLLKLNSEFRQTICCLSHPVWMHTYSKMLLVHLKSNSKLLSSCVESYLHEGVPAAAETVEFIPGHAQNSWSTVGAWSALGTQQSRRKEQPTSNSSPASNSRGLCELLRIKPGCHKLGKERGIRFEKSTPGCK